MAGGNKLSDIDLLDRNKLKDRLLRLTRFSGWMIVVQLINMVCGFLIVNQLSVTDYALFTLVLTLTMSVKLLGASGLNQILLFQGGENWQNPTRLGRALWLVLSILKWLFPVVFLVSFPFVFFLLNQAGFSLPVVLPYYLILGCLAFSMALSSLFVEVARLRGQLKMIIAVNFKAAVMRLIVVGPLLYFWTEPWLALLAVVPGILLELRTYGRFCKEQAPVPARSEGTTPEEEQATREGKDRARAFILRSFPNDVFYIFSSVAKLSLLAIFGGAQNVASFGALERFGVITTLVALVVSNVFLPYYAKQSRQAHLLIIYFLLILVASSVPAAFTAVAYLFPKPILSLLGENYLGLSHALVLMGLGLSFSVVEAASVKLMQARGHILAPVWTIAGNLGSFAVFVYLLDVTTLEGVLWLAIGQSATLAAISIVYACVAILREEEKAQDSQSP
ncbi:lipopolysaccharide biosynthesis protein [Rhodovibrionaceae bacterium A322]